MPVTSGFSGFPHFTQRLLLTTSTYSFYFIFFYAKREIIFRKRTHGVWKRWVQICFYFLLNYKKKVVILLSYFSVTKSTKSHLRGFSILLKITFRVHELVAGSSAWQVRAAKDRAKVGSFAALHGFSYTTRANISHEEAEQIRARIACTPAYIGGRAWIKCMRWRNYQNKPYLAMFAPRPAPKSEPRGSP